MMDEKTKNLPSFKGMKKRSYSMEFKKQVLIYAEANSNRSAFSASNFDVKTNCIKEWKKYFEKTKSTKPNRQRLDGGGRKCIDENLEEDFVHWIY